MEPTAALNDIGDIENNPRNGHVFRLLISFAYHNAHNMEFDLLVNCQEDHLYLNLVQLNVHLDKILG
jgi:hypothetical protein